MKLTNEQIEKYKEDFHFSDVKDHLDIDWFLDRQTPFLDIQGIRHIQFIGMNREWLRIKFSDLTQEQIEELIID